jgi:hypothetical protein
MDIYKAVVTASYPSVVLPARPAVLLFALTSFLLFGGCRVDATVEARVSEAGGTVTARFLLDPEAVALLGGAVGEGAQTSDLAETGWQISPVRRTDGGGAEVQISKAFHRPGDLGAVIGELAGPAGPLRGFRLDRRRGLTKETYRVRGTADLGAGMAAATGFGNTPDLSDRLRDAGVDPERVEELLADRAAEGFHLRLVVDLPGRTETFEVSPGAARAVDVSSSVSDRKRPVLLALAVAGGLIVLLRVRRRPLTQS